MTRRSASCVKCVNFSVLVEGSLQHIYTHLNGNLEENRSKFDKIKMANSRATALICK